MKHTALLALIALIGCNQPVQQNSYISSDKCVVDSAILPNCSNSIGNISYYQKNGHISLIYLSKNMDRMYFYEYDKKKLIDSLPTPDIIRNKKVRFCINADGQIDYLTSENDIVEYDPQNKATHLYKYPNDRISLNTSRFNFEKTGTTFLIGKTPKIRLYNTDERKFYFTTEHIGLFSFKNDSTLNEVRSVVKFPPSYTDKFYHELMPMVTRYTPDSIAYIFSNSPILYKESLSKGSPVATPIDGLDDNHLLPENLDSIPYLTYNKRYEISSNKYSLIRHDSISKRFIVLQVLGIPADSNGPYMPVYDDKPFVIHVISTDNKVIKKIHFDHILNFSTNESIFFNNVFYTPAIVKDIVKVYAYKTD